MRNEFYIKIQNFFENVLLLPNQNDTLLEAFLNYRKTTFN